MNCQVEGPPNATSQPFRQMQPQGVNEHHVGELLRDQGATRLRVAHFLLHAF